MSACEVSAADLAASTKAKSDQLNADDLVGGSLTGRIVKITNGSAEQPMNIQIHSWHVPWRPCKTERRVMTALWGGDPSKWIGKTIRLMRDAKVTFGSDSVGGVRIESASGIDGEVSVMLNAKKGKKARRTVALAPSTVEQIRQRVESTKPGLPVFTISAETLVHPQHRQWLDAWYEAVRRAQEAYGVALNMERRPRIHDIRHSHASMMIAADMNLFELADRLGHESIITTTKTYGHLVPDAHFRASAMVETAMNRSIAS